VLISSLDSSLRARPHHATTADAEGNSKTMAYSPYGVVGKLTDRAGKTATFR
jgi:hypothetical protein